MNISEEYLQDLPHSFGGKYRSYQYYKDKQKVDDALKGNAIYTRYKPYKKLKYHIPTYVYRKRQLIQLDITYFEHPAYVRASGGYPYLLTCIDVFTKYVWCYPIKDKSAATIVKCMQQLFTELETLPELISTDRGTEFKNRLFENLLRERGVRQHYATSDRKCAVVERFNLTIQQLVYKLMDYHNTTNWVSVLPQALKIYLNRVHTTTKFSPIDGEKEENHAAIRETLETKYKEAEENRVKPKFKVGDHVRIWVHRGKFKRGYTQNYTDEYFKVKEVLDNLPQPRYILEDLLGEEVDFILFQNELVGYTPKEGEEFRIEKIVARRTRNGRRECLVKWIGWPDKYNSWEPENQLIDL